MLSRSLSDCQSPTLNVMMQVLQFVRNSQLCHSLRPSLRPWQKVLLCQQSHQDQRKNCLFSLNMSANLIFLTTLAKLRNWSNLLDNYCILSPYICDNKNIQSHIIPLLYCNGVFSVSERNFKWRIKAWNSVPILFSVSAAAVGLNWR